MGALSVCVAVGSERATDMCPSLVAYDARFRVRADGEVKALPLERRKYRPKPEYILSYLLKNAGGTMAGESSSGPSIGLALGGGAARGLAHIVVLEALDELGIKPSFVAGCSIGALLGAAYASGLSGREIREHALSVLGSPGAAARSLFWPQSKDEAAKPINLGLFRPVSLNGLGLVRLVSPPGIANRVEDTIIPFAVSTTDFYTGCEVTITTGDMKPAVAASIAIPGVIEAPRLNGRVMIDGAYTNPVPMQQVRARGCEILVAVDVTGMPVEKPSEKVPGPTELMLGSTQILQKEITRLKAEAASPDVMIIPAIDRFGAHDFLKIREILASAEPERDRLKRLLEPLLAGHRNAG